MSTKFDKFEALSEDKQKIIMNAAMKEFVKGGYDKASVNNIVEAAGISKGSLFYYFSSKKMLYLYLFEYSENLIIENTRSYLSRDSADFIRRMSETMAGNMNLLKEHPLVFAFARSCKMESSSAVVNEVQAIKDKSNDEILSDVYRNVDESLFKDETDIQMAMFAVKSTMFQLVHDFMRSGFDDETTFMSKLDEYMDFFRRAFYK